jgi:hypothetical protein
MSQETVGNSPPPGSSPPAAAEPFLQIAQL